MRNSKIKRKVTNSVKRKKDSIRVVNSNKSIKFKGLTDLEIKKSTTIFKANEHLINSYFKGVTKELPKEIAQAGVIHFLFKLYTIKNPLRHHTVANDAELKEIIKKYTENIRALEKEL